MAIDFNSLKLSGAKIAKVAVVFGVAGSMALFNVYPEWTTLPVGAALYGVLDYVSHNYINIWGWIDFIFGKQNNPLAK